MFNSHWRLISACLASSFLGGALTSLFFRPLQVAAAPESVTEEIRAQKFTLVDRDGYEFGGLGISYDPSGNSGVLYLTKWGPKEYSRNVPIHDGAYIGFPGDWKQYTISLTHNGKTTFRQP